MTNDFKGSSGFCTNMVYFCSLTTFSLCRSVRPCEQQSLSGVNKDTKSCKWCWKIVSIAWAYGDFDIVNGNFGAINEACLKSESHYTAVLWVGFSAFVFYWGKNKRCAKCPGHCCSPPARHNFICFPVSLLAFWVYGGISWWVESKIFRGGKYWEIILGWKIMHQKLTQLKMTARIFT